MAKIIRKSTIIRKHYQNFGEGGGLLNVPVALDLIQGSCRARRGRLAVLMD